MVVEPKRAAEVGEAVTSPITVPHVVDKYGRRAGRMVHGTVDPGGQLVRRGWLDPYPLNPPTIEERKAYLRSCGLVLPAEKGTRVMLRVDSLLPTFHDAFGYKRLPGGAQLKLGGILYVEHRIASPLLFWVGDGYESLGGGGYYKDNDNHDDFEDAFSFASACIDPKSLAEVLDSEIPWDGSSYATYGEFKAQADARGDDEYTIKGRLRLAWDFCKGFKPPRIDPSGTS